MMWSGFLLWCLVASAASSGSSKGLEVGKKYVYEMESRTLSAIHQVSNQFTGYVARAKINVQPKSSDELNVKISDLKLAKIHTNLSNGFETVFLKEDLDFSSWETTESRMDMKFKNGVVVGLNINSKTPIWELNLIRSLASQFQVDTQGRKLIKSRLNALPEQNGMVGMFKTMESSVQGECETLYSISRLPNILLLAQPELAPTYNPTTNENLIDIVKTTNFSNCDRHASFHFGFTGLTDWEPASSEMGQFMSRTSISRVILSGSLKDFVIQSILTTNKVILSPHLYDKQKGMVGSRLNLTLVEVTSASGSLPPISNVVEVKDLVYEFNPASDVMNSQQYNPKGFSNSDSLSSRSNSDSSSSSSNSSESNSSSSSSSSEEQLHSNHSSSYKSTKKFIKMFNDISGSNYSSSSSNSSSSSSSSSENSLFNSSSSFESKHRNIYRKSSTNSHSSNDHPSISCASSSSSSSSSSGSSSSSCSGSGSSQSSDSSSSSSSSFSSSSAEHQSISKLDKAPNIPFLPEFIANEGYSIPSYKDISVPKTIVSLARDIASTIEEEPGNIPAHSTLEKFTIMVKIIRTLNSDQLQQITDELYYPYSKITKSSRSDEVRKYQAWVAFRDGVAEAGTGPALINIVSWIKTKKIFEMEAAKVVSVLPNSVILPSVEYIEYLFDFISSPSISSVQHLNNSAMLAFTNLLRKSNVDRHTYHKRYPVHSFGHMTKKLSDKIIRKYIPYFSKNLNEAVQRADSQQIQVTIKALGNIAHPRILKVFQPFLEGKQSMSGFQRLLIVASLNKMTKVYPKVAQNILFNIYENIADDCIIRCAAVALIMKTNPSMQLLQRMAQSTYGDDNQHVNSMVASAIETAARQKGPFDVELAKNAKVALNNLKPRPYGIQSSKNYISSYVVKEMNLAYKQHLAYIGSEDSIFPMSYLYGLQRSFGGFRKQTFMASALVSSTDDLLELMGDQTNIPYHRHEQYSSSSSSHLTPEKVAKILNIQSDSADQLEGQIMLDIFGGKTMFTFDNHTIDRLPTIVREISSSLKDGTNFNITRYYMEYKAMVAFPMATGLPFSYRINVPTLFYLGGETTAHTSPNLVSESERQIKIPRVLNVSADIQLVYSFQVQSTFGFTTPFDNYYFGSGVDKNFQVQIPFSVYLDVDGDNKKMRASFKPLKKQDIRSDDINLIHYSTWPYTTQRNVLNIQPHSQAKNTQHLYVKQPNYFEQKMGDNFGFAFKINMTTQQNFVDFASVYKALSRHDPLSALLFMTTEKSINMNHMDVVMSPKHSPSDVLDLTIAIDTLNQSGGKSQYNNEALPQNAQDAKPQSKSPDSRDRRREFLEKVSSGVASSFAYVADISAEFRGESKAQFIATAAFASSPVSNNSKMLFFYNQSPLKRSNFQVCLAASSYFPNVPILNFMSAIHSNPNSSIESHLAFGQNSCDSDAFVKIKGRLQEGFKRFKYISEHPVSKQCTKEMEEGNFLLPACRNATTSANLLNLLQFEATYRNIPNYLKNITYKAYDFARYFGYQYIKEDFISAGNPENKLLATIRMCPKIKTMNISLDTPLISAQMENILLNPYVAEVMALHPQYSATQRVVQFLTMDQQFSTCAIDSNKATTFDNKTYDLKLEKCWHVMMHSTPKKRGDIGPSKNQNAYGDISILVQEIRTNQREVKILLGQNEVLLSSPAQSSSESSFFQRGFDWVKKTLNLAVRPQNEMAQPSMQVNNKNISISVEELTEVYDEQNGEPLLRVYSLPTSVIRMYAPQHGFELLYDGARIKLQVNNMYRGEIRGLCGTFTGNKMTDFTTPQNCIVRDSLKFAASFAIVDETCQSESIKSRKQAVNQGICYRNDKKFANVVRGQYSTDRNTIQHHQNNLLLKKNTFSCNKLSYRTQKIDGQICFSSYPLTECVSSRCHPKEEVNKQVEMKCISHKKEADKFQNQIKKNEYPTGLVQYPVTHQVNIKIPKSCIPL